MEYIRKIFDGIPRLLGQKFKYSNIDRDIRARELSQGWHRELPSAEAEVDFVIQREPYLLPIEVKSGETGSLKSLHLFLNEKKAYLQNAVTLSSASFSKHDCIEKIPFYGIMTLFYK